MTDRVLELLRRAVSILETEGNEQPAPAPRNYHTAEDEKTLAGTLGRFEAVKVGSEGILLFRGTMKVRTPEGPERWVKFQAWRRVALWCEHNLKRGQTIYAIGKWETNEYTNQDGEIVENTVFAARLIQAE